MNALNDILVGGRATSQPVVAAAAPLAASQLDALCAAEAAANRYVEPRCSANRALYWIARIGFLVFLVVRLAMHFR